MRAIELNSLQLNAVRLNGIGECQRGSHAGAPPVVPDVPDIPDIPDIPEEPDVPTNPDVDENGYIIFEDAEVARICAESWGDGKGLTLQQAAAVTDIGTVFRGNTTITSFNEFKYFTSVTTISGGSDSLGGGLADCYNLEYITLPPLVMCGKNAFRGCAKLKIVELPASLAEIGESAFNEIMSAPVDLVLPNLNSLGAKAFRMVGGIQKVLDLGTITVIQGGGALATNSSPFYGCADVELFIIPSSVASLGKGAISYLSSLKFIVSKPEVPPVYGDNSLASLPALAAIYVPDASVSVYREASGWSSYASRIFPISQLSSDNPDLYEEIKEYL